MWKLGFVMEQNRVYRFHLSGEGDTGRVSIYLFILHNCLSSEGLFMFMDEQLGFNLNLISTSF